MRGRRKKETKKERQTETKKERNKERQTETKKDRQKDPPFLLALAVFVSRRRPPKSATKAPRLLPSLVGLDRPDGAYITQTNTARRKGPCAANKTIFSSKK